MRGVSPAGRRRLVIALASAVVCSGLVPVVAETVTAPSTQAAPTPTSAPNQVSAMLLAKASGARILVTDQTTETSQTWANPDGTLTDEMDTSPSRVQNADGSWTPVDTTLSVNASGRVAPAAVAGNLSFSDGGSGALVSWSGPHGQSVSLSWPTSLPVPSLDGSTATYANVAPNVDLLLSTTPSGWEYAVRFDAPPTLTPSISLPLTLQGLTVTPGNNSSFTLSDSSGGTVFNAPPGVVKDSDTNPVSGESLHQAQVAVAVADEKVNVSVPSSYWSTPGLTYPVTVDPAVIRDTDDLYTSSANPSTSYYEPTQLYLGDDGTSVYRDYLAFSGWTTMRGKHILSSYLQLFNSYSSTCANNSTNEQVDLYSLSWGWHSTTTWSNQGAPGTQYGSAIFAYGRTGCAAAYTDITTTGLVQNWAAGTGNAEVLLKADQEGTTYSFKRFNSAESSSGTPTMYVTYNSYPSTPTSLTPAGGTYWASAQPTLSAAVSDPDGGNVQGKFFLQDVTAGNAWISASTGSNGNMVQSGGRSSWTPPALTDGHVYRYQVESADSVPDVSAATAWTTFTEDMTAPTSPTVSSAAFPSGQWASGPGTGSFTFASADSGSGVDHYLYGLDTPTPGSATASGVASASVSVGDGWHTLYVRGVDKAGNLSTVTSYSFGAGAGVLSPAEGTVTAESATLTATTAAGATQATFYYRRAATDAWTIAPAAQVSAASGSPAFTGWPYSFTALTGSGDHTPPLVWDVAQTLGVTSSPVQVGVCFGSAATCPASPGTNLPASASSATPVNLTLDVNSFDVAETQDIGPGSVNLLTGNLQISTTDASVPGNNTSLSVGRTFNTFTAGTTNGIFGPGWTASLPVDSAGEDYVGLSDTGSVLTVTSSDQSTISFAKTATAGSYAPTGENADSGLSVVLTTTGCAATYRCYDLDDLDGNKVLFQSSVANPGTASLTAPVAYNVISVTEPGSANTTTFSYQSGLVSRIISPIPSGATCTDPANASTWTASCRGLDLAYASGKLTAVTYDTSDGTNPLRVDLACYDYDTNGRLWHAWDPRNITTPASGNHPIVCNSAARVRPITYTYDSNGRVSTFTPSGLAQTTFTYEATTGRLASASLSDGTTTYTTKVLYRVPLTADVSNPQYRPDLSNSATSTWAQSDTPDSNVGGTAICPPASAAPTDANGNLDDCTVTYLDVNGHGVNSANYSGTGASGWHVSTSEYDAGGHVVRTLTPGNREEALSPTSGAGAALDLPANTATAALDLSTINDYTNSALDGQPDLTDSFGPYHQIELANGTMAIARQRTHVTYDDGTEAGHPKDGFNQPIAEHLVRTQTVSASLSADAVATNETDTRTTETRYWLGTDYTGWTFHSPMQTIADPSGLAITNTTVYDPNTGNVTESRMPSNTAGGTAGTTKTIYYTADASASDSDCRSKLLWAGLVCKTLPAAQPGVAGLPSLVTTWISNYDYLQRPTVVQESATDSGSVARTRTTTTTYGFNGSGNPYATTYYSAATSDGGYSTTTPMLTATYSATTGLATGTSASATTQNPATSTSTAYDSFGRVTSFTDDTSATGSAQANTTTTTYDSAGGVASSADAHTTRTYTYNGGNEHRGLPTQLLVNVAGSTTYTGTFTAVYDASGGVASQTDPDGVTETLTRDENGQIVKLSDTNSNGTWMSNLVIPSVERQWLQEDGLSGNHSYKYDAIGRLAQATDAAAGGTCAVRSYSYDADSNRLTSTSYAPNDDGTCQTTTGTATSHGYDSADRLQNSGTETGIVYDAFGRVTSVPAADVTGTGDVGVAYYANDLVRTQTQNGITQCWTLDAGERLKRTTTYSGSACSGTATADRTNHYDDTSSDSPDWISENAAASNWTANVTDLTGSLAITVDQAGTPSYQYVNLHGDIASSAMANASAPTMSPDYGEFGTNPGANTRYGWLGGKQRSNEDLGGLTLMGVRLYDPALGRFLQTDPISGGSANSYDYSWQDPVGNVDLDGREPQPNGGAGGTPDVWADAGGDVGEGNEGRADRGEPKTQSRSGNAKQEHEQHQAHEQHDKVVKSESPVWNRLKPVRGRSLRTNGMQGRNKRFYSWDHTHSDIEVFDGKGDHLGTIDPWKGEWIKPNVPGRNIRREL